MAGMFTIQAHSDKKACINWVISAFDNIGLILNAGQKS
jgi:hypothetical protein